MKKVLYFKFDNEPLEAEVVLECTPDLYDLHVLSTDKAIQHVNRKNPAGFYQQEYFDEIADEVIDAIIDNTIK